MCLIYTQQVQLIACPITFQSTPGLYLSFLTFCSNIAPPHTHTELCALRGAALHPRGEFQLVKAITVVLFPLMAIGLLVKESVGEFWP